MKAARRKQPRRLALPEPLYRLSEQQSYPYYCYMGELGEIYFMTFSWSEQEDRPISQFASHRSSGLDCPECGLSTCASLPDTTGCSLGWFWERARIEHIRIHAIMADNSPVPRCRAHRNYSPRDDLCRRHITQVRKFLKDADRFNYVQSRPIRQTLERIAIDADYVEMAAMAAAESEEQRLRAKVKPRKGAPRGWRLGREILRRYGVSEEYLPVRRDAWLPGERQKASRQEATTDALSAAFSAQYSAWDRYYQAVLPAKREHLAVISALEDSDEDADRKEGLRRIECAIYRVIMSLHEPLLAEAQRAQADYDTLRKRRRVTIPSGETLSLPRHPMTSFWTRAGKQLQDLLEPRVRKEIEVAKRRFPLELRLWSRPQGLTAVILVRHALATIAPNYLLREDFTAFRDRLRNS